jgi:hypothetical protein
MTVGVIPRFSMKKHEWARTATPRISACRTLPSHHQGRTWYWEHLGLLAKASYKADWELKKQWYRENGLWDQVITSEDYPGGLGGIVYADEMRKTAHEQIFGNS